jgi:hypothetical protein
MPLMYVQDAKTRRPPGPGPARAVRAIEYALGSAGNAQPGGSTVTEDTAAAEPCGRELTRPDAGRSPPQDRKRTIVNTSATGRNMVTTAPGFPTARCRINKPSSLS